MFLHLFVILFTGGRGCLPHPRADTPPGQTPPQADTPPWVNTPWADTPPAQCMLGYGQQAGSTHPTGMQSCLLKFCISSEEMFNNHFTSQYFS